MEVDDEYDWLTEEASFKQADGPLPVSKRQQRKGLGPSVYISSQLPYPLSQTSLRKAQWFDLCPMTDLFFKETVEVMKEITPAWYTWDIHAIMRQLCEAYQSKKPSCFNIREDTPDDMQAMLSLWQHNPEGVPTTI